MERVEVIQKVQPGANGSDAIGGVINAITNKPKKNASVQFNAEGRRKKGTAMLCHSLTLCAQTQVL